MQSTPAIKQPSIKKIKRHAMALLARRDHTPLELKQKLLRKNYAGTDIDAAIASLQESGLINVARFAESYIHYRRGKGYGPKRIAMELEAKGVPEAVIAEHLEMADNDWLNDIQAVWRKHFKGRSPEDRLAEAKQQRFLFNRGFTPDQIKSVLKTK